MENNGRHVLSNHIKPATDSLVKDMEKYRFNQTDLNSILTEIDDTENTWHDFIKSGFRSSYTFQYWCLYLEIVDLLQRLLLAERDGDFQSHLAAVEDALPYMVAAGRNLYWKWIPVYLNDIQVLKEESPTVYNYLAKGNFVVKKSNERRFNCVASDMALEQSVNKYCKSTRHTLGKYSENFMDATKYQQVRYRKETSTLQKLNEACVISIMQTIDNNWCNPFELNQVPSSLINICTGKAANKEVVESITAFIDEVTNSISKSKKEEASASFWRPTQKKKVLTFQAATKKPKAKTVQFVGSQLMFRRILCAAQLHDLDLEQIMSFELTITPLSMFHEDGSMRKSNKVDFLKRLEDAESTSLTSPQPKSLIIDGMVAVQEINEKVLVTFNDLGQYFLKMLSNLAQTCGAKRITVVFDTYKSNSIKASERIRRGDRESCIYMVSGERKMPPYREFLKAHKNKQQLLLFLTEYCVNNGAAYLKDDQLLMIAGGFYEPEKVVALEKGKKHRFVSELYSTHVLHDTRIILHTFYESKVAQSILVKSVDTDVLLLLLHFRATDSELKNTDIYMRLGHGLNSRFASINQIVTRLGTGISSCLLGIHALTGCDTTNALFKIGKTPAFDVLSSNIATVKDISKLVQLPQKEALELATRYILLVYRNKNKKITTLNHLGLHLAKTTNKQSSQLPPTNGAFLQHLLRCIYQLNVWYRSKQCKPTLDNIADFGWSMEFGFLSILLWKQSRMLSGSF